MKLFLIGFAFVAGAIFVLQYFSYCAYAAKQKNHFDSAAKPHQNMARKGTEQASAAQG